MRFFAKGTTRREGLLMASALGLLLAVLLPWLGDSPAQYTLLVVLGLAVGLVWSLAALRLPRTPPRRQVVQRRARTRR